MVVQISILFLAIYLSSHLHLHPLYVCIVYVFAILKVNLLENVMDFLHTIKLRYFKPAIALKAIAERRRVINDEPPPTHQ